MKLKKISLLLLAIGLLFNGFTHAMESVEVTNIQTKAADNAKIDEKKLKSQVEEFKKNILKGTKTNLEKIRRLRQAASLIATQIDMYNAAQHLIPLLKVLKQKQPYRVIDDYFLKKISMVLDTNVQVPNIKRDPITTNWWNIEQGSSQMQPIMAQLIVYSPLGIACGMRFCPLFKKFIRNIEELPEFNAVCDYFISRFGSESEVVGVVELIRHFLFSMVYAKTHFTKLPCFIAGWHKSFGDCTPQTFQKRFEKSFDTVVMDELFKHTQLIPLSNLLQKINLHYINDGSKNANDDSFDINVTDEFENVINDLEQLCLTIKADKLRYIELYKACKIEFETLANQAQRKSMWMFVTHYFAYTIFSFDSHIINMPPDKNKDYPLPQELTFNEQFSLVYSGTPFTLKTVHAWLDNRIYRDQVLDTKQLFADKNSQDAHTPAKIKSGSKPVQMKKKPEQKKPKKKNNSKLKSPSTKEEISADEEEILIEEEQGLDLEQEDTVQINEQLSNTTNNNSKQEREEQALDTISQHQYAQRILSWFNNANLAQETFESVLYHGFSLLVDDYLFSRGRTESRPNVTRAGQMDTVYKLVGQIIFKGNVRKHVVFHATKDPQGICYHRGLEWREGNLFDTHIAPSFWNISPQYKSNSTAARHLQNEYKPTNSNTNDVIEEENDLLIQIRDNRLGITIILYK